MYLSFEDSIVFCIVDDKVFNMEIKGCFPVIYPKIMKWIFDWIRPEKIMTSVSWLSRKQKETNIHEVFNYYGLIFLDCGTFQFFMKDVDVDMVHEYRKNLVKWYSCLRPEIVSSLDIPSLLWHSVDTKILRLELSLENYLFLKERIRDIPIVLGICAFSEKSATIVAKKLKDRLGNPSLIGLGGQVPLLRLSDTKPELGKLVVSTIRRLRNEMPESFIHVYGAGGHRWYMLVRLAGADSADYAGFAPLAGKGQVFLPGLDPHHILQKFEIKTRKPRYVQPKNEILTPGELKQLESCLCPACKNVSDVENLKNNRKYRIIHNLYTVISESQLVDEYCNSNDLRGLSLHVEDRLIKNRSSLSSVAKYCIKLSGRSQRSVPLG